MLLKPVHLPPGPAASLMVGMNHIPQLFLEEKEHKIRRMLLVSAAPFPDILIGARLVVLVFQLATTAAVLAILGGFTGDVLLLVLYLVLGTLSSLSAGVLVGALFNSAQAAARVSGFVAFVYIISGIFVGQPGELMEKARSIKSCDGYPCGIGLREWSRPPTRPVQWGKHLLDTSIVLGSYWYFQ